MSASPLPSPASSDSLPPTSADPSPSRAPSLRVLIVDDEPLAQQRVLDLLAHEADVEIVGTAESGPAAIEAIRQLRPDLVFLDIQMPGVTGLDVVRTVGADVMPATIFVTAYDQHALQAFELAAVDYLVKPFDDERFEQAFQRARHYRALEATRQLHEQLLTVLRGHAPRTPATPPLTSPEPGAPPASTTATMPTMPAMPPRGQASRESATSSGDAAAPTPAPAQSGSGFLDRIAIESRGKVTFLPVAHVDYIAASGPYAEVVSSGRRYLIREAMQVLERRLDPTQFVRIHRSAIVRLDRVDTLFRGAGGDYEVQLRDGTRLRVSRSRRDTLAKRLGLR